MRDSFNHNFKLIQKKPFTAGKAFKVKICLRIAYRFAGFFGLFLCHSAFQLADLGDLRAPEVFIKDSCLTHHNLVDEILEYKGGFDFIKQLFCRPMFLFFPPRQSSLIDPQLLGQLLLCQPMNPPVFSNPIS
jgi:hypothetical protein